MTRLSRSGPLLLISGIVFLLTGGSLAVGGVWLLLLGGSFYYLLAGVGIALTGGLLARGRREALWLYALVLFGSTVWALVEVRLDWWQLLPRLDLWFALGLWLYLPFVNRRLRVVQDGRDAKLRGGRWTLGGALVIATVVGVVALLQHTHDYPGEFAASRMAAVGEAAAPFTASSDWSAYGRSGYGDRYAPAHQITPQNAGRLQLAWTFHTGDFKGPGDPLEIANEVTPLKANGMLYLCTPHNIVIALDPDSGKERWRYDPKINREAKSYQHMICRGVAYHDSGAYVGPERRRGCRRGRIGAAPRRRFGAEGRAADVDDPFRRMPAAHLRADRRRHHRGDQCRYRAAVRHFGDHGVIGLYAEPADDAARLSQSHLAAGGDAARADRQRQRHRQRLHRRAVRRDPRLRHRHRQAAVELGHRQSGRHRADRRRQTTCATRRTSWSVSSVDEKLGLVYLPMGNQTPDIWGGNRNPHGERFNSAIVALDIATAKCAGSTRPCTTTCGTWTSAASPAWWT